MRSAILFLLTTSHLAAIPAVSELTLADESGFNKLALTINPPVLPADTETSSLTSVEGEPIIATLNVDPDAGTTSELSLAGGRFEGSDTSFSGRTFLVGSYSVNLTNLGGTLSTTNPPGPVNPATGKFDTSLHQFSIDQGQAAGSLTALIVGTIPIDVTFTPENAFSGTSTGEGTVTLTETSSNALTKTFDVAVTVPIDFSEDIDADGQNVNIRAVGTIKLVGTTEVPLSEYIAWTIDNSIPGEAADADGNHDGVPNGIAWALGYDAATDASPSLPRPSATVPGGFDILLPPGGTAAPLLSQRSTNLANWTSIDPLRLSNGTNPIPAGTSGTVTITPDSATAEFIRLMSSE